MCRTDQQRNCLRLRTAALLGLSALLLSAQAGRAQNCSGSFAAGPGVPDEHYVHIGDSIHFYAHINADATVCILDGGNSWVIIPDGTVHQIVNGFNKPSCGSVLTIDCPADAGCTGDVPAEIGPSGFLRFKYGPITPADVGRALPMFTTPRGTVFTAQFGLPLAGKIWLGTITDARTTDCNDPNTHDQTSNQGVAHVTVVSGSIPSITINCVTNTLMDERVVFGGTVCNQGDIAGTNVTVSDNVPAATITFSNQTSLGNPFPVTGVGRLVPGECVSYTGSFSAFGRGCGPYPITVTAGATDESSYPARAYTTNSATCVLPRSESIAIFGSRLEGTNFVFGFITETNRTYTVQVTDSLSPTNWHSLTSFPGDCFTAITIRDSITNAQRFYRLLVQ